MPRVEGGGVLVVDARCNSIAQAIGDPGRVVVGRVDDEVKRFMLVFPELPGD
jgi:hypothetical protein